MCTRTMRMPPCFLTRLLSGWNQITRANILKGAIQVKGTVISFHQHWLRAWGHEELRHRAQQWRNICSLPSLSRGALGRGLWTTQVQGSPKICKLQMLRGCCKKMRLSHCDTKSFQTDAGKVHRALCASVDIKSTSVQAAGLTPSLPSPGEECRPGESTWVGWQG